MNRKTTAMLALVLLVAMIPFGALADGSRGASEELKAMLNSGGVSQATGFPGLVQAKLGSKAAAQYMSGVNASAQLGSGAVAAFEMFEVIIVNGEPVFVLRPEYADLHASWLGYSYDVRFDNAAYASWELVYGDFSGSGLPNWHLRSEDGLNVVDLMQGGVVMMQSCDHLDGEACSYYHLQ